MEKGLQPDEGPSCDWVYRIPRIKAIFPGQFSSNPLMAEEHERSERLFRRDWYCIIWQNKKGSEEPSPKERRRIFNEKNVVRARLGHAPENGRWAGTWTTRIYFDNNNRLRFPNRWTSTFRVTPNGSSTITTEGNIFLTTFYSLFFLSEIPKRFESKTEWISERANSKTGPTGKYKENRQRQVLFAWTNTRPPQAAASYV